ncbi:MAG: NAD(P)H-hydrate epimerase [Sedimentisphaerales bacterium]|jgi:NAD(P)H-hydrate epimerase
MKKYQQGETCPVMSRDQVRAFDAWAINELGVPGVVLMENAGRSCAEFIKEKLSQTDTPRVCIFCGTGNNGGDGFVIARHLLNAGFAVVVIICGRRDKIKGDAKVNLDILKGLDAPVEQLDVDGIDDIKDRVAALARDADMIVDAVFGTGLMGELRNGYKRLIETINALGRPILAVDIPSGLDCDTGNPLGAAIKANWTVTFVAVKKGFVLENTRAHTGEVYVASIGIEPKYV